MKFKATDLLTGKVKVTVEIVEMPITDLLEGAVYWKYEGGKLVGPFGKSDKDEENRLLDCIEDDFQQFLAVLKDAGTRMTDPHYFKTHYAGSDDLKYRERLYCYELYHQLRCLLGDDCGYRLDGEMDKAADPDFKNFEKVPDFIAHFPGTHVANMAVIEVKKVTVATGGIKSDVQKLVNFVTTKKRRYHRAIMLVYGDGQTKLPPAILKGFDAGAAGHAASLMLLWHEGPGKALVVKRPAT